MKFHATKAFRFLTKQSGKQLQIAIVLLALIFVSCSKQESGFVKVNGSAFSIDGKPYFFLGTNMWYGINLASAGKGGDRERLKRELDHLKKMGVNNIRIMAGSEGPDTEPYRMIPSMQPDVGVYNEEILVGLDFILNEMKARDMYAVMCMSNFWNWSGGLPQYIVWSGAADSIPYPPPHPGGNWDTFQKFCASFYSNEKAMALFNNHIKFIINRKNSISGLDYKDDPTIMSWELANEPRGVNNIDAYRAWANNTAKFIKSLDSRHLVTIGSEGETASPSTGNNPVEDHKDPNIDYLAMHLWVENWSIFNPHKPDSTIDSAINFAKRYIARHKAAARTLNKPLVMEEFGISRDLQNHDPAATTNIRDRYYSEVFQEIYASANESNSVLSGCNFWAWAGEGLPARIGELWRPGDPYTGEPPHENQGWYSVFAKDSSTNTVITKYAEQLNSLRK